MTICEKCKQKIFKSKNVCKQCNEVFTSQILFVIHKEKGCKSKKSNILNILNTDDSVLCKNMYLLKNIKDI